MAESIQKYDGGNSNILVIFSIAVIFKVQQANSYFNQLKKYKLHWDLDIIELKQTSNYNMAQIWLNVITPLC